MKIFTTPFRLALLGICISFVLSGCFINIGSLDVVVGNGNIQTKTRELAVFTKIENRTFADIDITAKAAQKLELTTDENIQAEFQTVVTNGKLIITTSSASITTRTARFTISMQTLDDLNNTGSGDMTATSLDGTTQAFVGNTGSGDISVTAVQTPTLAVSGVGSGNIALRGVAIQTLTANISGSGNLSLKGTGNTGSLTVSGSGDIDARDLTQQRATARATGSGGIRLSVVQSLEATVSGSGSIIYYGSPTVNSNVTGSGRVSRGN